VDRFRTADIVLLVCVSLWGLNVAVTKYAFGHGFEPLSWAGLRFAVATLIFVAVAVPRFGKLRLSRDDMVRLAIWGGVVFATNQIGFSWSLEFASAATVALLFGTLPLFAGLFSELLGIERLGGLRWFAAMLSFAGIGLVAIGATTGLHASVGGILLALYAPAAFALYSIALAPLVRRHGTLRVNTLASLFCLPVLLAAAAPDLISTDWGAITGLAWLCLAFSIASYVPTNLMWFAAVDQVGATRASVYVNLQPFFGAISAMFLLSEEINTLQWIGGVVIVAGIVLSHAVPRRVSAPEVVSTAPHE
jgi:drug/metabolite transporter (DMT)-like permease